MAPLAQQNSVAADILQRIQTSATIQHLSKMHLIIAIKDVGAATSKLTSLFSILELARKKTGNTQLPVAALQLLIEVGKRPETSMECLETATGLSQAAVSRTVKKLGKGGPSCPGAGLLEAYEDPEYGRQKLVKLTSRGKRFIKVILEL